MAVETEKFFDDFVHVARIALSGRTQDVQALLLRVSKRYRNNFPELAAALTDLLRQAPTRASPLRRSDDVAVPVDTDSRFQLLRVEYAPVLDHEPVFAPETQAALDALVAEQQQQLRLREAGLDPVKTAIFTGPPGVGKTLAARWIARTLGRPLLILDLSAVMSSYLGRTGTNLRNVLDYAKSVDCVLLLDELDAIAKRRDDLGEIGELKRLVTVLLQQLDDWPPSGLLVAATNHSELLDPAIWRRFETVVQFPLPTAAGAARFIESELAGVEPKADKWAAILSIALANQSFSDIDRHLKAARRGAALGRKSLTDGLIAIVNSDDLGKDERIAVAAALVDGGITTQRQATELTGIARDTIRAHSKSGPARPGRRRKDL